MRNNKVFYKRVELDKVFSRKTRDFSEHWVGSTVKGFQVVATNNEGFSLSLVADPTGDNEGYKLDHTRIQNFRNVANNAVFENFIAQPGVWVEVMISIEDDLIFSGDKKSSGSSVIVSGGQTFEHDGVEVDDVESLLLAPDDSRASSRIFNYSDSPIYLGSLDKISDTDFMETCWKIRPGEFYDWDLPVALFARMEAGKTSKPIILEKRVV